MPAPPGCARCRDIRTGAWRVCIGWAQERVSGSPARTRSDRTVDDRIVRIVRAELSRRTLLKSSLGALAAALPLSRIASAEVEALAADLLDDIAILNFALTLEHLESRAYRDALASGKLTGKNVTYAQAYGAQEAAHVTLLTHAIAQAGKTPVTEQETYNFPAFSDEKTIVGFLRILEETGVGAYTGAARYLKDKSILATAVGIVQVEARHAAILRRQDGRAPVPSAVESVLT